MVCLNPASQCLHTLCHFSSYSTLTIASPTYKAQRHTTAATSSTYCYISLSCSVALRKEQLDLGRDCLLAEEARRAKGQGASAAAAEYMRLSVSVRTSHSGGGIPADGAHMPPAGTGATLGW